MQNLVRSKTIGVTGNGGRGTAGAGPGRDLFYGSRVMCLLDRLNLGDTLLKYERTVATATLHGTDLGGSSCMTCGRCAS